MAELAQIQAPQILRHSAQKAERKSKDHKGAVVVDQLALLLAHGGLLLRNQ